MKSNKTKLAIRVDGNQHIGMGHFFRCFHLAKGLREQVQIESEFLVLESSLSPLMRSMLEAEGFILHVVSGESPWVEDISKTLRALKESNHGSVLVDLLKPDPADLDLNESQDFQACDLNEYVSFLKKEGFLVVAMSDRFDEVDFEPDLLVNTCPAQQENWYAGKPYKALLGAKYYIFPSDFMKYSCVEKKFESETLKALVFCGGNDHVGFTKPSVDVLKSFGNALQIKVLLGAATPHGEEKVKEYEQAGIEAHFRVEDLGPLLFESDFILTCSGNTLFDLAGLGVPALAFSTRPRQGVTSNYFEKVGSSVNLGPFEESSFEKLKAEVDSILKEPRRLKEMSDKGRETIDGHGLSRLISEIEASMHSKEEYPAASTGQVV